MWVTPPPWGSVCFKSIKQWEAWRTTYIQYMLGETNILNIKNPLPILQTVSSPSFLEVSKSVANPESQTNSRNWRSNWFQWHYKEEHLEEPHPQGKNKPISSWFSKGSLNEKRKGVRRSSPRYNTMLCSTENTSSWNSTSWDFISTFNF